MDNFDDISEKYRNEIINLYKNQDNGDIPNLADENVSEQDIADESTVKTEDFPVMPPAVAENAIYDRNNESAGMGKGFLKIKVTTGNAYPLENALVIVTRFVNENEEIVNILQTDESGETPVIELDAPLKNGKEISDKNPYLYYNIMTSADGYYQVQNRNVALFSGITSIQPVNLVPLPAYTDENNVQIFYEQEPNL